MNDIDAYVEYDEPIIELNYTKQITDGEKTIGKKVAELIEDRSARTRTCFPFKTK